jgi:hypothetical protein
MKRASIVASFVSIVFLLAVLIVLPVAHADQGNQETRVTFSQPVQIPGRVLPAGTYVFVLPEEINDHFEVRIFNADRTMLVATLFTINTERAKPTDNTVFGLAERGSAQPEAIVTWFYPGETTGHEFLYPKQVEKELASAKQVTIFAGKWRRDDVWHQLVGGEIQAPPAELAPSVSDHGNGFNDAAELDSQQLCTSGKRFEGN